MYVKTIAKKNWIRLVCVKTRSEGCEGRVTRDSDVTEIHRCHLHDYSADDRHVRM